MVVTHIDPLPTAGVVMAGGPRHHAPCCHELWRASVEGQQALGGLPFGKRVDGGGRLGGGVAEDDLARWDDNLDFRPVPIELGRGLQRLDVLDCIPLERDPIVVHLRCNPTDVVNDGGVDQRRVAVSRACLEDRELSRVLRTGDAQSEARATAAVRSMQGTGVGPKQEPGRRLTRLGVSGAIEMSSPFACSFL